MRYEEYVVTVTTVGSAGAATGTADTPPINGEVEVVYLNYDPNAPNTTTVDIDEVGGSGRKILDKAASKTDVTHYPRRLMQGIDGADLTGVYERLSIPGRKLRVTVAASDALAAALIATIIVREDMSE